MKIYKIYIEETLIGTSYLENADPPMGVVYGKIFPIAKFDYLVFKKLCKTKSINIETDYPKDKFLSTISSDVVKKVNSQQTQIKGIGNQISGMDKFGFEISILGI